MILEMIVAEGDEMMKLIVRAFLQLFVVDATEMLIP
jgi:hypothetical protein